MSASTKLSNAIKALCFLAEHSPAPQSSATISRHTGVNASKIRKLLSDLARTGIVATIQGAAGGFVLARLPKDIHLQEIYCGIEDRKAFHLNVGRIQSGDLDNAAAVNKYFLHLFEEIQVELEDKMRKITLESILTEVNKSEDADNKT